VPAGRAGAANLDARADPVETHLQRPSRGVLHGRVGLQVMASCINGGAAWSPAAIGSGQPASALVATVPTDWTRTSWRSHPTGVPTQVNTRFKTTTATRPPSIPAGMNPANRHLVPIGRLRLASGANGTGPGEIWDLDTYVLNPSGPVF
jgi:hypothetical protein